MTTDLISLIHFLYAMSANLAINSLTPGKSSKPNTVLISINASLTYWLYSLHFIPVDLSELIPVMQASLKTPCDVITENLQAISLGFSVMAVYYLDPSGLILKKINHELV